MLFVSNVVGLFVGPVLGGALSDALRPALAEESLRYTLVVLTLALPIAGMAFFRAAASFAADRDAVAVQS